MTQRSPGIRHDFAPSLMLNSGNLGIVARARDRIRTSRAACVTVREQDAGHRVFATRPRQHRQGPDGSPGPLSPSGRYRCFLAATDGQHT